MTEDLYAKNLALLETRHRALAEKTRNSRPGRDFVVLQAKNGFPVIREGGGRGFYLHSPYDPIREARLNVDKAVDEESAINIIYGSGLGYHIMEVFNRCRGKSNIIIEPSLDLFRIFLRTNVATAVLQSPDFIIAVGNADEIPGRVTGSLDAADSLQLARVSYLSLPGYEKKFGREYKKIQQEITKTWALRYMSVGNSAQDTLIGLKNSFASLDCILSVPGINALKNKYEGVPALLIAAGPSLDKNISLIREVKGRGLIICADASIKKVLKNGIEPDIVASIERDKEVYDYFFAGVDVPPEIWFAGLNVVDSRVFEKFGAKSLVAFRSTEPLSRWLDELAGGKGCLTAGMSVANLAFSIARLAGCNPIILVGQDLAYGDDGVSHASGTLNDYEMAQIAREEKVYVEDYDGNLIPSRDIWRKFLTWFEAEIAASPEITVIDATEGGARIQGSRIMKLRDAIGAFLPEDAISAVSAVVASQSWESTSRVLLRDGLEKMGKVIGDFAAEVLNVLRGKVRKTRNDIEQAGEFSDDIKAGLRELEREFNRTINRLSLPPYDVLGFITQSVLVMTAVKINEMGVVNSLDKGKELTGLLGNYCSYMIEIAELTRLMLEEFVEQLDEAVQAAAGGEDHGI